MIGVPPGERVVVATRRGYDMWNTRYFVLPFAPHWTDEHRGFASFLPETERVYPPPDAFKGRRVRRNSGRADHPDYQIFRNLAAYPRAWVVHNARWIKPITGLDRESRDQPMQELLYQADPLWTEDGRQVYDPRSVVWLDNDPDHPGALGKLLPGTPVTASGKPSGVTRRGPQRVELDVSLETPGVVVLADIYYPGWTLTIDGQPAPIYRANRMMRGAGVPSGKHHLVYTYRPASFRVGGVITIASLLVFAVGCLWVKRQPRAEGVEGGS